MVFKKKCFLVPWAKVASALEGLNVLLTPDSNMYLNDIFNGIVQLPMLFGFVAFINKQTPSVLNTS